MIVQFRIMGKSLFVISRILYSGEELSSWTGLSLCGGFQVERNFCHSHRESVQCPFIQFLLSTDDFTYRGLKFLLLFNSFTLLPSWTQKISWESELITDKLNLHYVSRETFFKTTTLFFVKESFRSKSWIHISLIFTKTIAFLI